MLSTNVFAKIDSSYEKQIYEGCINDAKRNNDFNSASKKFCKCYANQFNKKFNNEQLVKFLNKSQQEQAKIINNEMIIVFKLSLAEVEIILKKLFLVIFVLFIRFPFN